MAEDLIENILSSTGFGVPQDTKKFPNQSSGALSSDEIAGRVANARSGAGQKRDFGQDLKNLSDVDLNRIYGKETSLYRDDMSAELQRQREVLQADAPVLQQGTDAALGAASGLVGVVGGVLSAGTGLAGEVLDSQGLENFGTGLAQSTGDVTGFLGEFQSDELSARKRLSEAEGKADAANNLAQYERDRANGEDSFIANLTLAGRDALNAGERIMRDGAVTTDVVAQGIGSLGPSAKLAQALGSLAPRQAAVLADAIYPTVASGRIAAAATIAEKSLQSIGIGVAEASGAYTSTVEAVMNRSPEEMASSPEYVALIGQGVSHEDAQRQVANNTGLEAYARQMPTAMAAGALATKFNTSPLTAFEGKSFMGGLREVGTQALEEGIQGGTGQLNQNIAIRNQVDGGQILGEGVGEQVASGVIGGAGMSGAIAAPAMAAEALDGAVRAGVEATVSGIKYANSKAVDLGTAIMTPAKDAGFTSASDYLNKAVSVGSAVADAVSPIVSKGVDALKTAAPVVSGVVDKAKEAAAPVFDKVKEYNETGNQDLQVASVRASLAASVLSKNLMAKATSPDTIPNAVKSIVETVDASPVPEAFSGLVTQGSNLVDSVTGILQSFTSKDTSISSLSESAVLYASDKFSKLQSVTGELPGQIQEQVKKVLASSEFKKIQERLSSIDLNKSQTAETEITPDVKATTVAMAKVNPANVNPDVVNKILEQDDRTDLTEQDVKLMGGAAKIAKVINDHVGRMVELSNEKQVSLTSNGGTPEQTGAVNQVSRSILVSGMTTGDGKKLRSVNDYAGDIFKGSQTPNKTVVGSDGIAIPVDAVTKQFGMFVKHLSNKVEAMNQSYDQNNDRGRGPSIGFESLVGGREMRTPDKAGAAAPVAYHKDSETSVRFAKKVHADAVAAANVYNTLVETFPELFPEGKVTVPTLRGLEESNNNQITEVVETKQKQEKTVSEKPKESKPDQETKKSDPFVDTVKDVIGVLASDSSLKETTVISEELVSEVADVGVLLTLLGVRYSFSKMTKVPSKEQILEAQNRLVEVYEAVKVDPKTLVGFRDELAKLFSWFKSPDRMSDNAERFDRAVKSALKYGEGNIDAHYLVQAIEELNEVLTEVVGNNGELALQKSALKAMRFGPNTVKKGDGRTNKEIFEEALKNRNNTTAVEAEVSASAETTDEQPETDEDIFEFKGGKYKAGPIEKVTEARFKETLKENLEANFSGADVLLGLVEEWGTLVHLEGSRYGGIAFYDERRVLLSARNIQGTINKDDRKATHTALHELGHIIDAAIFYEDTGSEGNASHGKDFSSDQTPAGKEIKEILENKKHMFHGFLHRYAATHTGDEKNEEVFAELIALFMKNPTIFNEVAPNVHAYFTEKLSRVFGVSIVSDTSVREEEGTTEAENVPAVPGGDPSGEGLPVLGTTSTRFNDTFTEGRKKVEYTDGDSLLDLISQNENTEAYVNFARPLVKTLVQGMQDRLKAVLTKDGRSVEVLSEFMEYKNLLAVDPATGAYNERLLSLAAVALVDWLTSARGVGAGRLSDTLEDLGLSYFDLTTEDVKGIMNGVPVGMTTEGIAKDTIRLWNLKKNPDAQMVDIRGVSEGLIKELLLVLDGKTDLISIREIKTGTTFEVEVVNQLGQVETEVRMAPATTIDISGMKATQEELGIRQQNLVQKTLNPELSMMASIGTKIVGTDQTQSRGDVPLSDVEKKALTRMQDTPHFLAVRTTSFIEAIGFVGLSKMLGWKDPGSLPNNHPLNVSITGKNISIERDFQDAMAMVAAVGNAETPVYYPVGISKVGRHQMKGINPQNNKILRAMITPTHSKLNMKTKEHQDAFWLTVAQATGIYKVENKLHSFILANIQTEFNKKYSEAVSIIGSYLEGNDLDVDALVNSLGETEVAQLNAVYAVAELEFAKKNNKLEEFNTTLSFELDGKTDGPGNMMANFGQGQLTEEDYMNFQRVGFFLGKKDMTLNKFFSDGNVDLYETTSTFGDLNLHRKMLEADSSEKAMLYAAQRFAGVFGDFKINQDGSITMTRNTSKNPMTKTVYGSGVKGVGEGIAQDMMLGFYTELVKLPAGVDLADHFNYPNIEEDVSLLFGQKLPKTLDVNTFVFHKDSETIFKDVVTKSIGTILSETAKSVIGDKITEVNDLLVFITGVQTQFISELYQRKLDELIEQRAVEGKIKRTKLKTDPKDGSANTGPGIVRQLSQRDHDELVSELRAYSPVYSNGSQTLSIGSFSSKPSNITMSSTMDGKLRVLATMPTPDIAGVKVIPYVSIGRGDAMMMNTIYSSDNAPDDTIPVFDGIDMPVSKVMAYANQINQAVMNNWDANVLGDILADYEKFLNSVGTDTDLVKQAFAAVAKKSFKSSVMKRKIPANGLLEALKEAVRLNQARKAVFKRITVSVDHMGGSQTSYVRNADGKELTINEINQMIADQLGEVAETVADVVEAIPQTDAVVTDVKTVLKALEKETRKKHVRDTVKVLSSIMDPELKVVMGTLEEVQKYHDQNGSGSVLADRKGMYDVGTNTVYIVDDNHETMTHELIHMATFQKVLAHYNGEANDAVARLELLMEEFMDLDFAQANKRVRDAYNSSKAQILKHQVSDDAFSKAAALNEFMAWTLSNEALMKELKTTPTGLVAKLTKYVKAWMQRLLGSVPTDMYSNILFNVSIINQPPGDTGGDGNDGNGGNNDGGNVTPPAEKYTNFWIDRIREILEKRDTTADGKNKREQIERYVMVAKDAVVKLDFGGFALSEYQKQTFMAIHAVLATEMRLDTQSLISMGKLYDLVTNNLTPSMFGSDQAAQDRYSTVMELMGATKNDEKVSDAIAVLLALSQTSTTFRNALDQIPQPQAETGVSVASLNDLLTSVTGFMMRKAVGSIDMADKNVKDVLDNLSNSILNQDQEREFALLRGLMNSMERADKFVGGALSQLAQKTQKLNVELQNSTRSGLTKTVGGSIAMATQFLDKDLGEIAAGGLKDMTHMGARLDWFIPFREFISEAVGADKTNQDVIMLLDQVQFAVQAARQAYREELPVILQDEFQTHPDKTQWKAMHKVLGKLDMASIFDLSDPDDAMTLLSDQARLDRKIAEKEKTILRNFPKAQADLIMEKSKQYADFMNGKGAGFQLWKNAYAIHKLSGGKKDSMIPEIDTLITLYAINGADQNQKKMVSDMHDADPVAIHNLLVYMQGLNLEEDQKTISEAARLNGYKGYIPDHSSGENTLEIRNDYEREALERRGYIRVGDYPAEDGFSSISRGYYSTTVKQAGNYSQGVLQQVQDSYRGVNATTGLTVNGTVSGVISGVAVDEVTKELNKVLSVTDAKETLIPVFDETGVLYYERAINPDMIEQFNQPESNLGMMMGAWAGRQVEEKFAQEYNNALVSKLKEIWDKRKPGEDDLFVNMSDSTLKDKIYKESWKVIPPQTKAVILSTFGEDGGFMVRKDMINLALGYRDASIVDVWSGKTRLPDGVKEVIKAVGKLTMGDKAMKVMAAVEGGTTSTVSAAKDLIVIRSLVVPYMNTQANVFQLTNRGVAVKAVLKGYRDKFAEIDKYNENEKTIIGLEARIRLAGKDANRVSILKQQRQVLWDENSRMSIAPLAAAGMYKNISEGMTDLDVSITSGRFGDWVESKMNRLPGGVQTIVKYGLLSKDTAIYRGANKAVQYGDFIAKSIYYDHLHGVGGMTHDQALAQVNQEFVNFSILPGRTRSYLEAIGATWFLSFKIRSMKIAAQMIRDNPVRSLIVAQTDAGPVTDNLGAKVLDGSIDYSIGWEMLFDSPSMHPWIELTNG